MTPIALLEQCAPLVAPITMAAIVEHESRGNPWAVHDNTTGASFAPGSLAEAAEMASRLIAQGHSVDMGLAQINSRNAAAFRLSPREALDPCTNLRAAQEVLLDAWWRSNGDLRGALSAYNTGRTTSVIGAQYAAKIYAAAGIHVPPIPGGVMASWTHAARITSAKDAETAPHAPAAFPPSSALAPAPNGLAPHW